jgi:hypothetical protein
VSIRLLKKAYVTDGEIQKAVKQHWKPRLRAAHSSSLQQESALCAI